MPEEFETSDRPIPNRRQEPCGYIFCDHMSGRDAKYECPSFCCFLCQSLPLTPDIHSPYHQVPQGQHEVNAGNMGNDFDSYHRDVARRRVGNAYI